jgi:squalene cyclase
LFVSAFKYEDALSRKNYYRHVSEGGWPFSTSAHGWPISDCTAEGLKAVLSLIETHALDALNPSDRITPDNLFKACNVLLTLQNEDGGWATYENNRGFGW